MSFTRGYDDTCRVEEHLTNMTAQGRYNVNVPGNGPRPCYMEDPAIRLQKWGGNLRTNSINLESTLRGLDAPLSRDCIDKTKQLPHNTAIAYPTCCAWSDESRANASCVDVPRSGASAAPVAICRPAKKCRTQMEGGPEHKRSGARRLRSQRELCVTRIILCP